jgi:spore germination cell wall hydrolase CwlJ-like protein
MIALNRIQIVVLAALLAGCASAPQQQSELDVSYRVDKPDVDNVRVTYSKTQPSPDKVDSPPQVYEVDARSQQCLALALYWEARGEGSQGMLAVSSVVLNRVEDERFPDSVCGVVYEGGESPPCQFSWWCDGKSDDPTNPEKWSEVLSLAHTFLATRPQDPTDGALFYHSTSIRTPWRREQTAQIGNHIFYR